MTAVVVMPVGMSAAWAIGSIAITLAAWVVIAAWANPKAKRVAVAAVLATLAAVVVAQRVHASEDDGDDPSLTVEDKCKKYGPDNPYWWLYGCFLP